MIPIVEEFSVAVFQIVLVASFGGESLIVLRGLVVDRAGGDYGHVGIVSAVSFLAFRPFANGASV